MLTYRGRPIFASESPRRRREVVSWPEAIAMIGGMSLLAWLVMWLALEAIR